MIYAMVNKRFHTCLRKEAQSNDTKALYFSYSDYDLVHKVCRKERLTLFNFMKMHVADENRVLGIEQSGLISSLNEERIKELIH